MFYRYLNYIKMLLSNFRAKLLLVKLSRYSKNQNDFDFTKIKEQLLLSILKDANENVPYYKEKFQSNNINYNELTDFTKIPFLTKEIIIKSKSFIYSTELKKVLLYNMNTGGTTGNPLLFPVSFHLDSAHQNMAYQLFGYKAFDKIVCIDGTKIDEEYVKKNRYWAKTTFLNRHYGSIAYSVLYLNKDTVRYYVDNLMLENPQIIRGYPSAINYLAQYILENKIEIDIKLKEIQLTAESIFKEQIENIKRAFKCNVGLQYGHSEVSVFAYTYNDSYEYHCSPLYGHTEIIGEDNQHVSIGEVGEIVVTGFYNKALPFIRYRTGDMALYNGTSNGVVKIGEIYGRKQDYLYDVNNNKVYIIGLIYGGHNTFLNNIKAWQIKQNKIGYITVDIVKGNNFIENDKNAIKALFLKNYSIIANINYVKKPQLTKRGKMQFIIQNIGKTK